MSGRDAILARIGAATGGAKGEAEEWLAARPRGPRPARAADDPLERFAAEARAAGGTVAGPVPPEAVPAEIAEWLAGENLPARLAASPDPALDRYPWSSRPLLTLERRRAEPEDRVALTPCFAGVAETGTLAMLSGPERPVTLNFLPEAHIALVRTRDLAGAYEDLWERVRAAGDRAPHGQPDYRAVAQRRYRPGAAPGRARAAPAAYRAGRRRAGGNIVEDEQAAGSDDG